MTLVEILIVVAILGIIVAIAVPETTRVLRENKAKQCGTALRLIESAKAKWQHEYPGSNPANTAQLALYFPGGQYPKDPWNVGFTNELVIGTVTTHSYNQNPAYGDVAGTSGLANGLNDAAQP